MRNERPEPRAAVEQPLADRAALRRALREVNVPTLLMVHTQLTHDEAFVETFAPYLHSPFSAQTSDATDVLRELEEELRERMFALLTREEPIEPTQRAYDAFNAQIDARMPQMIWSHPMARSYYRNSKGRVFLSWPYRLVDYWTATRAPKPGDMQLG